MSANTGELLAQLSNKETKFEDFVGENEDTFIKMNRDAYWKELLEKSCIVKSDIINRSDIGYTYFYDIIRGDKIPSRDKIVRLILSMELSLEDCQNTLKLYNWAQLYAKDKRDSAMIYALNHKMTVWQLNEMMSENSIEVLK